MCSSHAMIHWIDDLSMRDSFHGLFVMRYVWNRYALWGSLTSNGNIGSRKEARQRWNMKKQYPLRKALHWDGRFWGCSWKRRRRSVENSVLCFRSLCFSYSVCKIIFWGIISDEENDGDNFFLMSKGDCAQQQKKSRNHIGHIRAIESVIIYMWKGKRSINFSDKMSVSLRNIGKCDFI